MKHPYSEILIAIAEGKEIQYQYIDPTWRPISEGNVLLYISQGNKDKPAYTFRIKPATITINGVECEAPSREGSHGLRIQSFDNCIAYKEIYFLTPAARDAAYAALIKPFGEQA